MFCACGAQWHGIKLLSRASDVVCAHMARWKSEKSRCGPISHDDYQREYRCGCADCDAMRKARREARRA